MSIKITRDDHELASFANDEVVEIRVVFAYGEEVWTMAKDGSWIVTKAEGVS